MKKLLTIILTVSLLTSFAVAQEAPSESEEDSKGIGLSFGIDYYSNYLWRGTKFYNSDGAICPSAAWEVFESGLTLTLAAEISESYLFDMFQSKPEKYYPAYDASGNVTFVKKKLKFNSTAYASHSLDFGADYSYTIKDAVTLGASIWYWWYFNSRHAKEFAKTQVGGLNMASMVDTSFLTTALSVGLDIVPYVNPSISVTYDYYTAQKRGGDIYLSLGFEHDFELTKEVSLGVGITGGYYYYRTSESTRYYLSYDSSANTLSFQRSRSPLIKGVSDISPSVSLCFEKGPLSLKAGFNWVIIPALSWYKGDDNHRYYATLGIGYSL